MRAEEHRPRSPSSAIASTLLGLLLPKLHRHPHLRKGLGRFSENSQLLVFLFFNAHANVTAEFEEAQLAGGALVRRAARGAVRWWRGGRAGTGKRRARPHCVPLCLGAAKSVAGSGTLRVARAARAAMGRPVRFWRGVCASGREAAAESPCGDVGVCPSAAPLPQTVPATGAARTRSSRCVLTCCC